MGNTRATVKQDGSIGQVQDYYAFGMAMNPGNTYAANPVNQYKYNGKELQDETGQYDYGARFYDPVIARWNTIDPLAEKSRRWSPYNYVMNNPIRNIDPDGMEQVVGPFGVVYEVGAGNSFSDEDTFTGNKGALSAAAYRKQFPELSSAYFQGVADASDLQWDIDHGITNNAQNGGEIGANQAKDPAGLKDFVAITSGEAAGNRAAARAIGSVLLNRLDAANSDLDDPNWMAASITSKGLGGSVKGNYQILRHPKQYEYKMVMSMTIYQIRESTLPYIVGALQAYDNRETMDYSNGAISWSATPLTPAAKKKDSNFQRVKSGIFTITTVAGNSTFFGFK